MPPLAGFTHNPFVTRDDFERAALALIQALNKYQSPGKARIRLPITSGTHFDETAAELEGFARPLWGIASLYAGNPGSPVIQEIARGYAEGLKNGTDPDHEEYWGPLPGRDQRMVEMEIIAFAMLAAPNVFYHDQNRRAQQNIKTWLSSINGKDMPRMNWLWFRIMTNLALVKVCGVPYEELKESMEADLQDVDSFNIDAWYTDGMWNEHGKQADYYSSSFAISFSQLLYRKYANDLDPSRCARYRTHARHFAGQFRFYFDKHGGAIPFGRSLTYRFALAGFWAAAACTGGPASGVVEVETDGIVKGFLLRHMRWWARKADIFHADGTLNLGFAYPNMYLTEDYNSPQSPYWCMKTFCALALSADTPFWKAEEETMPRFVQIEHTMRVPHHIVCNNGNHLFALSSGQFCPWPLKATEAKYGKLAYSSHFGFSVPTGPLLQQQAPDNSLVVSIDNGPWNARWIADNPVFSLAHIGCTDQLVRPISILVSSWKPSPYHDLKIRTILIPPMARWPYWHIRLHISSSHPRAAGQTIRQFSAKLVESGFAIHGRRVDRSNLIEVEDSSLEKVVSNEPFPECTSISSDSALVSSSAGVSGVKVIALQNVNNTVTPISVRGRTIKPDANTNLMWPRTLIPSIEGDLAVDDSMHPSVLAVAVFAVARSEDGTTAVPTEDILRAWRDPPVLRIDSGFAAEFPTSPEAIVLDELLLQDA